MGSTQSTLAIRARVPLEVLRDTIQPFYTFSDLYRRAESPPSADCHSASAGRNGDTGQIVRFWNVADIGR